MNSFDRQPRPIRGVDVVFQVLKHRKNEEVSIAELATAAIADGWRPRGKNPRRALGGALRYEIKARGDRARFVRGSRPGWWRLSEAGLRYEDEEDILARFDADPEYHRSFRRLMAEHDAEVADEDGL
jgi:hypothetical protein